MAANRALWLLHAHGERVCMGRAAPRQLFSQPDRGTINVAIKGIDFKAFFGSSHRGCGHLLHFINAGLQISKLSLIDTKMMHTLLSVILIPPAEF